MGNSQANTMSIARLRELLDYDPVTGMLTWKVSKGKCRAGDKAGSLIRNRGCGRPGTGYEQVRIDGRKFASHRIAWTIVTGEWPPDELDHINRIKDDNSFENLRLASRVDNKYNTPALKMTMSGFKGVSWHKPNRKWRARIGSGTRGKALFLGQFTSRKDAFAAYCTAATRLHGEFACVV